MITKKELEALRERYPEGSRVELVKMDDFQAPPIGTKGTIIGVDDTGSILVHWDTGSSLNVIYGVDLCRPIDLSYELSTRFEKASAEQMDELDFFMDLLETGFTLDDIREKLPHKYEYSKKFCEEHGLV